MSLQFVLGNSGSGKTKYMYEQIVREAGENPLKNYLIIVPEQFTLATQQTLVELAPNHAIMNIDVLSFKRLAYRVFDDMGIRDIDILEETGKNLILRKIAQEKENELTVLRPNLSRMGYIGEIKSLISEFVQYNIAPEQLEAYINKGMMPKAFSEKLKDIVTMYRGFNEYMKGKYITAEEILNVLISVADKSELLRDSVLVFDEFTGFTPIQNQLFYKILPIVDRIHILLTVDSSENIYQCAGEHELFYLTKKTVQTLTRMAEELGVANVCPVILSDADKKRFVNAPGLSFLEQNLFRSWYKKSKDPVGDIEITSLKDAREELVLVARKINDLVMNKGYRYKDIAVVTGAVDVYGNYVEDIFSKYKIPYFMDQTSEILFHPFIEFVRSVYEVIEAGFSYEAVMRFLRCGFCKIEEETLDFVDNYLLATGIKGEKAWGKKWLRLPKNQEWYDLEKLEEVRKMVYALFAPLGDAFSQNESVATIIRCTYDLFLELSVEEQLWEKETLYMNEGKQVKAKEYEQIYRIVMELFEKYYELLGTEHMPVDAFVEILEAGLSAAQVATVPPGYDNVTIGDIERTRLNDTKILFFVGVNDGLIPKSANSGGIISEYEREMLEEAQMHLAPGSREQAFIQRFYLYRNLTKPSDALYISYARVDQEGKKIRPSYLIDVVKKMFFEMNVSEVEDVYDRLDISTEHAAWDYLIRGKKDDSWYALANYFLHKDNTEENDFGISFENMLGAPFTSYKAEPISRLVAELLYGKSMKGSVTRLEKYAACAYAHFLKYGLCIKERDSYGFESLDIGNLYHAALEKYSTYLEKSEYDWFKVPDDVRIDLSERAFEEAVEEYGNMSIHDSAENAYQVQRMLGIFKQTVWALTKQVQAGSFVPSEFELSFSDLNQVETLKLNLDEGRNMVLQGKIDRLDRAFFDSKVSVKIIDYKSGNTQFDLVRVYRGLSLQLVLYMNAAMDYTKQLYPEYETVPGGILYYHIDDPVLENLEENVTEEEANEELLLKLRPDGLVNSEEEIYRAMDREFEKKSLVIPVELKKDGTLASRGTKVASTEEFQILEDYVQKEIVRQGKQILDGDVSVNPYKAGNECSCAYCPYVSVCGLDARIPGYGYRRLENLSKEEALSRMKESL